MRAALAQEGLLSDGWVGEAPEHEWAKFVHDAIIRKKNRRSQSHFRKFEKNWLLMYDNLHLPNVNRKLAVAKLANLSKDLWNEMGDIDYLIIESGSTLITMSPASTAFLPVNNLW